MVNIITKKNRIENPENDLWLVKHDSCYGINKINDRMMTKIFNESLIISGVMIISKKINKKIKKHHVSYTSS